MFNSKYIHRKKRLDFSQTGYRKFLPYKATEHVGWCKPGPEKTNEDKINQLDLGNLKDSRIVIFGPKDAYVAITTGKTLRVWLFDDLLAMESDTQPMAEVELDGEVGILRAGLRNPLTLYAIDEKNCLWSIDFTQRERKWTGKEITTRPRCLRLCDKLDEPIRDLVVLRHELILQTKPKSSTGYRLTAFDRRSGQIRSIGSFDLDHDIAALDAERNDIILGRKSGEIRLILPDETTYNDKRKVRAFELPRVTAATVLDGRYLVVARKGGLLNKLDMSVALPPSTANSKDPLTRVCKVLHELLRRCGCACRPHEDDGTGGGSDPSGGSGGRPEDDEPCGERHSAKLSWTVKRLVRVGDHVIAFAASNRRMAVLDSRLNLLFEQKLHQRSARVDTGHIGTQRMLVHLTDPGSLEVWDLSDYVVTLTGRFPEDFTLTPMAPPTTVTYYGHRHQRAMPNPHLNICVFTVVEPGQYFGDPNQNKLVDQITPNIFDVVDDYYLENSFGELGIDFSVFGHNFGGARTPLVLPRAIASYFHEDFRAGGIEAVIPADWAHPLVLDGTESMNLRANPRTGSSRDYAMPFAALWTNRNQGSFPVNIDFDGTETLQLTVDNQEGDSHVLNLAFDALNLSLNQGGDVAAFLDALGSHVTDALRAAEASLPGNPLTIQDVVFRRVRTNDNDGEFGVLQGQYRIAPAGAGAFVQKGQISITVPGGALPDGMVALGYSSSVRRGVLDSRSGTTNYLRECLSAARVDAGEGPGEQDPYFNNTVTSTEDTTLQELTVSINLTNERGGGGADIELLSQNGLSGSGWDTATPVPGSESNANNQNALRDSVELADDVFTAALDHIRTQGPWDRNAAEAMFANFDVMMIGFVGAPPGSVPTTDQWDADSPVDFSRLRMFARSHFATDQNNPNPGDDPVSMGTSRIIGQKFSSFSSGVMTHEIGHALGLPDLYPAQGYRDDVMYVSPWAMMGGGNSNFHHFCGWAKWKLGWIPEDEAPSRVIDVPMPDPVGLSVTEAWLAPIEYWDSNMHDDIRSEVGGSVPIGQLMKLHLGSDGGVLNFLELRAEGVQFSQNLSPEPTVIATNGLDPDTDRRWAVNGLYRRAVHLLNNGNELQATNDTWDFAQAPEFPVKGCRVEVADTRTIRGGTIPVYRLRVEREQAEFIDLYFQDNVPSYKSPDIWVDWPGDNPDPNVPRIYPVGTPTDQGETVRFPGSGIENHYVVARVHNAGNVSAEDVKVRWFVCDPPGSGDDGRWVERGTQTISEVAAGTNEITAFDWDVDSSTNVHQCMRMEIIDWTIPSEVDPATGDTVALASDDVKLQNNNAQQNVFDFEALSSSPYDPIEFQMQVHNDYIEPEIAALVPDGLPYGSRLEVSPAEAIIPPGQAQVFTCKLILHDDIIQPGCDNDKGFLLSAWRRDVEADELWGSCFYHVRPRYRTTIELIRGTWYQGRLSVYGRWKLVNTEVSPSLDGPLVIRVRLLFHDENNQTRTVWKTVALSGDGSFNLVSDAEKGSEVIVQAWFDRTDHYGSSVSNEVAYKHIQIG